MEQVCGNFNILNFVYFHSLVLFLLFFITPPFLCLTYIVRERGGGYVITNKQV